MPLRPAGGREREVLIGLPGHAMLHARCWGVQGDYNKAQFHPAT